MQAKEVYQEVKSWDKTMWEGLGRLVVGLSEGDLKTVSREGLLAISRIDDWTDNQTIAIADRTYVLLGKDDATLTEQDWITLARFAKGVATERVKAAGDKGLEVLGKLEACEPTPLIKSACLKDGQWEAAIESAKTRWGDASKWTKQQVGMLGTAIKGLTKDDIEKMTKEGVTAALEGANTLKEAALDPDQRAALAKKAKAVYAGSSCWIKDAAQHIGGVIDAVDAADFDCVGDLETLVSAAQTNALKLLADPKAQAIKKAIRDRVVAVAGEPSTWKAAVVDTLGGLVQTLEEADIKAMGEDALAAVVARIKDIDQVSKSHMITALPCFKTVPKHRDLRCVLHPAHAGAVCKNRSRIQN